MVGENFILEQLDKLRWILWLDFRKINMAKIENNFLIYNWTFEEIKTNHRK